MKAAKLLLALLLVLAAFTVIQPSIPPAHAVGPTVSTSNASNNCNGGGAGSTSSFTCTLSVTSGDLGIIFGMFLVAGSTSPSLTVTDSQSNTFTSIASFTSDAGGTAFCSTVSCGTWAFKVASYASTGTDTFTFTFGHTGFLAGNVYDITGAGGTSIVSSTTPNQVNSGTALAVTSFTLQSNSLTLAGYEMNGNVGTLSAGTTFSLISGQPQNPSNGFWGMGETSTTAGSPNTCPASDTMNIITFSGVCVNIGTATSTINLTCIVKESGAPTETLTLTGGSPSPSTANCSTGGGTVTAITVTPGCTLTATVATDGANTRYRFNASATSATTQNISCPSSGGSKSVMIWNYYQLQQTYQASTNGVGPPVWTAGLTDLVTGTVTGVAGTTVCTISPTNGVTTTATCSGWADYNLAVGEANTMTGAPANTKWQAFGTCSWTDTTGGNTHTCTYYFQLQNTYKMTPTSPATWDQAYSKSITGTEGGVTVQVVCGVTLNNGGGAGQCTGYADFNTAVSEPVSFAAVSGNWVSTPPTSFTDTTGGNTHNVNYKNIVTGSNTFKATPIGSTWDAIYNIAITGPVGGVSATVCTIVTSNGGGAATCSGSMDLPGTATFPATVGATTTEQWLGANPLAFTTSTSGNTFNVNYWLQFNNTFKATPNSPTTFDFTATVAVSGTSLGGSVTLCNISIVSGQGAKSCHAYADTGSSASMPTTLNAGEWTNEPPAPVFKITSGGNTFNVLYDAGPITTNTIIGWNFPSGTTYSNALLPIIAPLLGGAALVSVMYMFKRKGDLVVTLWLLGVLLGTAFFALNNGTALTSDFIPFAMLVVEAFQFVAWIWISGIGGNPGGQQQ